MTTWDGGWTILKSLAGVDWWTTSPAVPVWVPMLVAVVALGHLLGAVRRRATAALELPTPLRVGVYLSTVVGLVVFAPGVSKTFIYIQF